MLYTTDSTSVSRRMKPTFCFVTHTMPNLGGGFTISSTEVEGVRGFTDMDSSYAKRQESLKEYVDAQEKPSDTGYWVFSISLTAG